LKSAYKKPSKPVGRRLRMAGFILLLPLLSPPLNLAKDKKKDPDEIGNRDVGRGINFYSFEKEVILGMELAKEVELQAKILYDPTIGEYVNRLGQNLARNSDVRLPFTIKVLDSEEVNALALPGGFLFVNAGLILTAETEAELAAAMAHEIAHVAARHATRQATRATIMDYSSLILIFVGGQVGYAVREAAHLAAPIGLAKFSRLFESEADFLGLQYLYKTGYDPTAFVDLFERLESLEHRKPRAITRLVSTHPSTRSRCRAIQKNIRTVLRPRPEYVVNTSEFDSIRARLLAIYERRRKANQDWYRPMLKVRSR
jgi:predicted Zn-dependent protease